MARKSWFPAYSLDEALLIAQTIFQHNAGNPMRRLTLFGALKRSPDSGSSRQLLTASSNYGLTEGGYSAESIKLTERGRAIVEKNDAKARLDAVLSIDVFQAFFEQYRNAGIPSEPAALDFLKGHRIPQESVSACLQVLIESGKQIALIQEISGTQRIVSPENALEKLSESRGEISSLQPRAETNKRDSLPQVALPASTGEKVKQLPSLNINIQIHLPADAKPESYEAIFKNIREYLMDMGKE